MRLAKTLSLGQRLRRERQRLNWSQERLAEAIGATAMSIHRWEHDQALPQARYREQLCQVFHTGAEVLFATSATAGDQAHAYPRIWSVPSRRNPYFTGREAVLQRLHQALHSQAEAALTQAQAICGLGGIGKTQTALEYAYRYRDEYHAVLWTRSDTRQGLLADVVAIAALLQLPQADDRDQQRCVEAVKGWLNEQTDWLLILDNVEDLLLLDEILPQVGQGHLLLTTRVQAVGTRAQAIELEPMAPEEGALFLLRRAKRLAPDSLLEHAPDALRSQALAIAEIMDGLPLALDQAGAYLEETACDLVAFLDHYQARRAYLLAHRGERVTEHPDSVSTTFSLAIEQVERANPAAAELLRLCAFLHPDAIPEELLACGADELGPILQSTMQDAFALDGAIKDLRRFSLLRRTPSTKTLSIHRLVQAVVRDAMSPNSQRQWAELAVRAVGLAFPCGKEASWQRCPRCLPHAQVCATYIAQWNMSFPEAARLLDRTGNYLRERGHYTQARPLLQSALTLRELTLGPEQPLVAESLNDLAVLYNDQGNYAQAEPLYQRALVIYERTLGPEHSDLANCFNNLAFLYSAQGKYAQAEPLYQRALLIYEQTLGSEHPNLAHCLNNLAALYRDQGKYAQAEPLFQQALLIREQALGPEHPSFAYSLNALARLYYSQGKYAQAEPLYQQALLIREQALGPEHPRVALCLNYLADLYSAQGKFTQAESLSQRALAIRSHCLNPEHPDVAQCLNTLAKLAHVQGQYDWAHALFQQALAIREKSLGPEHPAVAETLTALGCLYCSQGKYVQAEPLLQQALNIREKSLDAEHPEVAETLAALGQLYAAQQKHVEAAALLQRALAIWGRCLDSDHPSVIACMETYAVLLGTREQIDQASTSD